MPPYKRMENRKYNQDEIKYVLSRVHAGWDDVTIAKAFKKDHAKYWGNRDFTKKQAAYIRSCYKVPYGQVSIKPYKGPIPQFSDSPKMGATSSPNLMAQQRGIQTFGSSEAEAADNYLPAGGAQQQQRQQQQQDLRAMTADPSNQGQNFASGQTNLANDADKMGIDPFLLQPSGNSAEDPFDLDAFIAGSASGDFEFVDFSNLEYDPFELPNLDAGGDASQGMHAGQQAGGNSSGNQALASIRAQLNESSPDLLGVTDFNGAPSAFGLDSGLNIGDGFGQGLNGTNPIDILARVPDQLGEQHQQQQQQQQQQLQAANPGALGFQPHHPIPSIEAAQAASETQIPLGYTAEEAAVRDPYGVWYYGGHDQCRIARTHRHDTDGGVYFTGELGVYQSFLDMRRQEGIGFLLGMATAQMVQGAAGHPLEGWQGAAEIARGTLPEEEQGGRARTVVAAPDPEIVERLTQINRQLPPDHYYEPFTNRIVRYTLPPGSALQGNNTARDASRQPLGSFGGPTQ